MGRNSDANLRLMDSALELMWEESYGAVTIDDICQRADVKKGSFYYFFKSKADLAIAALERLWQEEWKPKLDQQFSPSVDPLVRLGDYLDSIYRTQVEVKSEHGRVLGCPLCTVGSEISTQEENVCEKVRELFQRKLRYYESTIRDGVAAGVFEPCNAAEKAAALHALIEGSVSQARILNDPQTVRSLRELGFRLLGARQPATPAVPA